LTTKKIKVLLVDDHSIVRNGIRMMIDTVDDIDVTGEAASATEALSIMQQKSFDIALLDIELPDSSGLDLLNRDFPIELNFYWKPLENHHDFIEV
jgi:YesN/AraC family two-component response regulator